ncbi:hypothetical protein PR048_033510 [Dryococelus australis]|uniref:Uncharacterized protein n=1 Tax=Dryococelus australis TaxID=614101 RepID=A0ABQ9G0H6_9NEOP|nr:hypothetical protein PR048_033510 [Dryococelus australis]
MPGMVGTGGVTGLGARFMMRLQFGRGQAMRWEELLHINRQLQGHRTYFFPGGIKVHIPLKPGCCPVYKTYQKVPLSLKPRVEAEFVRLEQEGNHKYITHAVYARRLCQY